MSTPDNIILVGFSATGKSAVGKKVALRLERQLVDTDEEVVRLAGKPIPEIFEQDGEPRFRELEKQALGVALAREGVVVVTGGGAVLDPQNRRLMHERGRVFCLEARPETIHRRLANDIVYGRKPVVRPLLQVQPATGSSPSPSQGEWDKGGEVSTALGRIRALKSRRQPYYAVADWTIYTDDLDTDQVAAEVVRGWRYLAGEQAGKSPGVACEVSTPAGSYPVYVGWGLLEKLGQKLLESGLQGRAVVISDDAVFPLHGSAAIDAISRAGEKPATFTVPAGEASKTLKQAEQLYDFLIGERVERGDFIVALGGGVVGDLAGYVAATFLRGLAWVVVPTSVIAMVDAAIGGKVAVDHPRGKNLIGAFHHPRFVLSDTRTLDTLPDRELTSGWAEVIKHGFSLDADLVSFLEKNADRFRELDRRATAEAIAWSARIKARVVSEDDRERGKRILLNYGHTVAHGLEAATGYRKLSHGEAVAVGMMAATGISLRLGLIGQETVDRQRALLQAFGLPVDARGTPPGEVLRAMELDKKVRHKKVNWVLLEDIGRAAVHPDVPGEVVAAVLEDLFRR